MCGIAGSFRRDGGPVNVRLLDAMTAALAHRGPDGQGTHVEPGVALGHRRLSIIDVAHGSQPLSNEDGSVWVTFNGELYGYAALRDELEARGHRFRTRSDTEVLVHLYEDRGDAMVESLRGMFAFALWDRRQRRLLLARDQLGKKPLYIVDDGRQIHFASELKSLLLIPELDRSLDPEAIEAYLTFGYVPSPLTIYRAVRKLRPAELIVVEPRRSWVRRYWHLRFEEREPEPLERSVDRVEAMLHDAVTCRLMSEVPLGAFLSGGVDSSLVVAHAQRALGEPLRTLAVGFGDTDDELQHAAAVAGALGTAHREHMVVPRADDLPRVTAHFDEPFADPSALPTWWLSAVAREDVTVAISGDGGDESFGGYSPRYPAHLIERRVRDWLGGMSPLVSRVGGAWPTASWLPRALRLRTPLQNLGRSASEAYLHDVARLRPEMRESLLRPELTAAADDFSRRWFGGLFEEADAAGAREPLARLQYVDTHSFLAEGVLVKVDRASMAHGLEVRSPLLDVRLVELSATLPASAKIKLLQSKRVLRAALRRHLDHRLVDRPKQGFDPPRAAWLRGSLRPLMQEALHPGGALDEVVDVAALRPAWQRFVAGGPDASPLFWTMLCFDLWARSQARPSASEYSTAPLRAVAAGE